MALRDKDKGVNVQVVLRCRPCNEEELRLNVPQVISCNEGRREVSLFQNIAGKQTDRTFTFDRVFGPLSQQKDIYDQVMFPLVNEVLEGFNCTVFAYGQTGTGKTYTMEGGGKKARQGELSQEAGVIPRAIQHIFESLESQMAEYSVKVTFLELYNEELTDLLAPTEDLLKPHDKEKKPLALMEDGKGGVMVRGLEEEMVKNASEIYSLLDRGSAKRKTAETLLNKQSSRSHSIFSITIHIKEATPEGEELIKCGKLNLVDLAGSENISRSGARDGRAREAGEINKSLLTLGRVITALVEHLGHVPYRDSKLTRLLRDSLGGRTKTCVVATVSSSVHCLEETLSTLDYAHRAKNIKNKPEVNQKMTKTALLKDLSGEIERLRLELYAAREKNGVYLPKDQYLQGEAERKALGERVEQLECELELKVKLFEELQAINEAKRKQYESLSAKQQLTESKLNDTATRLVDTREKLQSARLNIRERDYVIQKQQEAESRLTDWASNVRTEYEKTADDVHGLFAKLDRKYCKETEKRQEGALFQGSFSANLSDLQASVEAGINIQQTGFAELNASLLSFAALKDKELERLQQEVQQVKNTFEQDSVKQVGAVKDFLGATTLSQNEVLAVNQSHSEQQGQATAKMFDKVHELLTNLQQKFVEQRRDMAAFATQHREALTEGLAATQNIAERSTKALQAIKGWASDCSSSVEQLQNRQEKDLLGLRLKYEEQMKAEEQELHARVAALLAASSERKLQLVQESVTAMQAAVKEDASAARVLTGSIEQTATSTVEDVTAASNSAVTIELQRRTTAAAMHCGLEQELQTCVQVSRAVEEKCAETKVCLDEAAEARRLALEKTVSKSLEESSAFAAAEEERTSAAAADLDSRSSALLSGLAALGQESSERITSWCGALDSQHEAAGALQDQCGGHVHHLREAMTSYLERSLEEMEATGSTPRKRSIVVPKGEAYQRLLSLPFERLQEEFRREYHAADADWEEVRENSEKAETQKGSKDDAGPPGPLRNPLGVVN